MLMKMLDDYKKYIFSKDFIKYVDSEKPLRDKAWENVHTLYLPLNIKNKHWVSLAIQLDTWEILVFDCNINNCQ